VASPADRRCRVRHESAVCRREQAADQGVPIAHRTQQQSRRWRRLLRVAPESVRANGVDEERNTRRESDDASGPFENGCDLGIVTIAPWTIRLRYVDAAELGLCQDAKPSSMASPYRFY
jgi:hypothetical protein